MNEELQNVAGYREAEAEYAASVAIATKEGDELAKLKLENEWLRKEQGFRSAHAIAREQEAKLALTKEQITKDYPNVPQSLFKHITDPEALLELAKDFSKNLEKQREGSWGTPGGAPSGAEGGAPGKDRREMDELVKRVNTGNHQAIQEYRNYLWTNRIRPYGERTGSVTPLGSKA